MSVELTWVGHSAFILNDGTHTVLIDPWFTGNPVNQIAADSVEADAILITHAHGDHVGDAPAIAARTGATICTINELANYLSGKGLENVVGGNHGGTLPFPGGTVKLTPAWHSSTYSDETGAVAPGVPAGMIVRFGGLTMYFAGDTALFGDMQLIGEEGLDLAVIPIGDKFTMGPKDGVRAAKFLNATRVIPCHYNTFPPIRQDGAAFKAEVEAATNSTVTILAPGESTTLD
ncbi:MAG: metal-dependent hydrolase [Thermomicrobiales bacterium]|nr:metal-dependent hydrolase [Thermomicrobiales bacterium]